MEKIEKQQLKEAKRKDPRFAEKSRITDGAYIALLAQKILEDFEEDSE
jgi:hypothetical protein